MSQSCYNTNTVIRKGAWTAEEDTLLKNCIEKFGEGKWHLVPLRAGLNRCRKSCRLRWLNYLRSDIKRGEFSEDEIDLMLRLHKLLGNRWALIAGRLPGRTANDIKNYWNTNIKPRSKQQNEKLKVVEPMKHTMVTVIKPQPHTISKALNFSAHITTHDTHNLITSSTINDIGNALNFASNVVSSSTLPVDKINEYLDELFDDWEMKIDDEVGWPFRGVLEEGGHLEVVKQADGQNDLFDFPIEDVDMMGLIN